MVPHSPITVRWRVAIATGLAGIIAALSIALADPVSPVSMTNVDSPDPVPSGSELTYSIRAVNTGGAKIDNVVLTDQLNGVHGIGVPPAFVLTSTRGSCTQTVDLVTCNAGQIEGGGVWVVTIRGIVTASGGTTINNTASISGNKTAQNFTTTTVASTLVTGSGGSILPDLTLGKTGPASVAVSSPMTYTLTVNNLGLANATNIKVVDTLPLGLSNVTTSTTSLFTCATNEPALPHPPAVVTVTCNGGAVNAAANGTITINATSPATAGTITNTASVDPDSTIPESNELNNTSSLVNTQVGSAPPLPQLSVDVTDTDAAGADFSDGAGQDPITPGQTLTYKVLVKNNSTQRADDVAMVNGTQGLGGASVTINQVITNGTVGTGGGCTVGGADARCLARTLNAGGSILYTITGTVVASAGSTILNTATVSGNIKNKGVSSTDTELTTVRPGIDLTITKVGVPNPVCASSFPTTLQGGAEPVPTSPPLLAPPVCLGGLKYTMVIGNSGVSPASGVVVRDELPAGSIFDHITGDVASFTGGCSLGAGNILTCSGGNIPAASTRTLVAYVVAPPSIGLMLNRVTVDPANAIFEADETNNIAVEGTVVGTGVDLTIVKDDSPPKSPQGFDPIATSGTQTYVIKVDNIGPQSASNIHVRDTLPAGTIFRNAQGDHGFTCSHSNGIVDCVGGSLPGTYEEFYADLGEQQATIVIRLTAIAVVGTMHNEVRVDPLNLIPEVNKNNNIDFEDTTVTPGGSGTGAFNEFSITKVQTSPLPVGVAVARNAKVTYAITIKNDGTDPATGVTVRDFLPAGAVYIEATGTNQFLCNQFANFIECGGGVLGKVLSGTETATITLSMFAPDTPGSYTNQAIVDPQNTIPEGNEFNNQASAPLTVENGGIGAFNDLTITKEASKPSYKPDEEIVYTLTVKNIGDHPALNVAVRDILPADVTFVSAKDTTVTVPTPLAAFTCGFASGIVNCTGATLDGTLNTMVTPDVPDTRTITIKVKAPSHNVPANGLINQASVDPDNTIAEGDELNNSASVGVTVASAINLRITKTGPTESTQSQTSTYTITAFNDKVGAGQDAFNVQILDPLPVGLIPLSVFTSSEGSNYQCSVAENPINLVQCVGDLPAGTNVVITVDVFMTAEGSRKLDNEACIDPANTVVESNENDNCSTATTLTGGDPPKVSPDLLVTKSVAPGGPVTPGTALVYTVLVSNIGTAKAAGPLKLTDKLPDHVTFTNYEATNGWVCDFTSPNLVCHEPPAAAGGDGLEVGASAQITIHATYDGGATAPIVNTATADAALVDGGPDGITRENEQNTDNNVAFAKNSVGTTGIDLVVSKIVDQPDPVVIGQKLTYTIIVVNGGTEDTSTTGQEVVVRIDVPPTGVVFLSGAGSNGFNCLPPNLSHQVICKGALPAGGDTTITLKFTVVAGAPEDLTLTTTVDPNLVITETDEGNNTLTETTTVAGDACPGPPCIDLVAAQLVGSPDPYPSGADVTMSFILVNVGDTSTTLDPTDPDQRLASFDVAGVNTGGFQRFVTPTNPASPVTCSTDPILSTPSALFSNCFGNLGPGEGVTITVVLKGVTGASASAVGKGDPDNKVAELLNSNNNLSKTVIKQ